MIYSPKTSRTEQTWPSRYHKVQNTKFYFSDYHLAHSLHIAIKKQIVNFDIRQDGKFEQTQLLQALRTFSGIPKNEYSNYISEALRYDGDQDKAITYEQFVQFWVHTVMGIKAFGGSILDSREGRLTRTINKNEFVEQLTNSLQTIEQPPYFTVETLEQLFSDIEPHSDKITYENYLIFLKEYFTANRIDPANADRRPVVDEASYKKNINRLSTLVFTQVRAKLVDVDQGNKMKVSQNELRTFLEQNFRHATNIRSVLTSPSLLKDPSNPISYNDAVSLIISLLFAKKQSFETERMSNEQFVERVNNNQLEGIRIKPARYVLDEIYEYLSESSELTETKYQQFLFHLGNGYKPYESKIFDL